MDQPLPFVLMPLFLRMGADATSIALLTKFVRLSRIMLAAICAFWCEMDRTLTVERVGLSFVSFIVEKSS